MKTRVMAAMCALLATILQSGAAIAQEPVEEKRSWADMKDAFERGCGDDRGVDRCDSKTQQRMHAAYRIDSPQELLASEATARRAMFVDGYGNDVVSVTFIRRQGAAPVVEVATETIDGFPEPQPLVSVVSKDAWDRVLARSRNFDALLASEIPKLDKDGKPVRGPSFCLHAWFTIVEAVDAPRPSPNTLMGSMSEGGANVVQIAAPQDPGRIRVDAESACAGGLSQAYAFELAEIAFDSLAECSSLDPDGYRNLAEVLRTCSQLRGDRLAAGEAMGLVKALNNGGSRGDEQALRYLFAGMGDRKFEQFKQDIDGGQPYFLAPRAEGPHAASVEGRLVYYDPEAKRTSHVADISLALTRQFDRFRIASWSITNKRPYASIE